MSQQNMKHPLGQPFEQTLKSLTSLGVSDVVFNSSRDDLYDVLNLSDPVGIYDSGLGGLQVLWNLYQAMPYRRFVYFADLYHMPYGDRCASTIIELSQNNARFLEQQGCSLIIAACHTSTTWLKSKNLTPSKYFLSMADSLYSVVEHAVWENKISEITLLTTQGTLNSGIYQEYFARRMPTLHLRSISCPGWVPTIESQDEEQKRSAVVQMLHHINTTPAIVYGCTHFSAMDTLLQEYLPSSCLRLDPGIALAETLKAHSTTDFCHSLERSFKDQVRVVTNVTRAPQLESFLKKFPKMYISIEYISWEKVGML